MRMTAQHVTVREAQETELPVVIAVLRAANSEFQAVLPAPFYQAYLANVLDVRSRRGDAHVLVAELGEPGEIVGAITLYPDAAREGWGWPNSWAGIRAVAVEPTARGLGIGRALAETCIERSRALGAAAICLHTAPFMESAIRMYERVGFRRAPEYDGDAGDMLGAAPFEPRITALAYRLELEQRDRERRDTWPSS